MCAKEACSYNGLYVAKREATSVIKLAFSTKGKWNTFTSSRAYHNFSMDFAAETI